jgi:hypothetical protein
VGLKSLKSLNLTNGYPNKNNNNKNKNKNKNNKVKSKPLELFELAGKNSELFCLQVSLSHKQSTLYAVSADDSSPVIEKCSFVLVLLTSESAAWIKFIINDVLMSSKKVEGQRLF